jgi:hypothetical protein
MRRVRTRGRYRPQPHIILQVADRNRDNACGSVVALGPAAIAFVEQRRGGRAAGVYGVEIRDRQIELPVPFKSPIATDSGPRVRFVGALGRKLPPPLLRSTETVF